MPQPVAYLLLKLNPNLKLKSNFKAFAKGLDSFHSGLKALIGFFMKSYNTVITVDYIIYGDGIHRAEL